MEGEAFKTVHIEDGKLREITKWEKINKSEKLYL